MNQRNISRRIERICRSASFSQIEQASQWYSQANDIAQQIAIATDLDLEQACAVIAALSPRMHWSRNIYLAFELAAGRPINGLGASIKTAEVAKERGFAALSGPKVIEFAKAIYGDDEAVVVDVWICKAIRHKRSAPTPAQYRIIARAIRNAARRLGLSPRTCQALVWIITRGRSQ